MSEFLATAHRAADAAAAYLLQHFGGIKKVAQKESHHSIVTAHDVEAERILIATIRADFPDHGIYSEECGFINPGASHLWVLDPLDGSSYYSRGIGTFAVSIALVHQNEIVMGMIHVPKLNQLFYAESGSGAFCNQRPISVSAHTELQDCIGSFGHRYLRLPQYEPLSKHLLQSVRSIRGGGSCAMEMALLASGNTDLVVTANQSFWDYAAGKIIVEEAGGKVVDLHGRNVEVKRDLEAKFDLVASNGLILI
ncbi:MAG: inositol monophosphatase [Chitinophagales bacterium]